MGARPPWLARALHAVKLDALSNSSVALAVAGVLLLVSTFLPLYSDLYSSANAWALGGITSLPLLFGYLPGAALAVVLLVNAWRGKAGATVVSLTERQLAGVTSVISTVALLATLSNYRSSLTQGYASAGWGLWLAAALSLVPLVVVFAGPRIPFLAEAPATEPATDSGEAFWFAVDTPREVRDSFDTPQFQLTPGTWYLAKSSGTTSLVVQHDSGAVGVLTNLEGITRA